MDDGLRHRSEAWERTLVEMTEPWLPDGERIDVHVHLGTDAGTGEELTEAELDRQAEVAGIDRAVLIPLNASDGYGVANMRLAELASASDGRRVSLVRVDPAQVDAARLEAAFELGAVGIKLHPVSDDARPADLRLRPAIDAVAERRGIVLVHAGIDVDGVATEIVEVAERHPDARFVIGHVAADSLATVAALTRDVPNVFTCTAWWGMVDLAWAMTWSSATRFVFGSDPPYGSIPLGLAVTARIARCVGYDDAEVAAILGGTAAKLLEGGSIDHDDAGSDVLPDASPAESLLARMPAPWQRCYVCLEAAAALAEAGSDPQSQLQLAVAALERDVVDPGLADSVAFIDESAKLAAELFSADQTRRAYITTVGAACIAATAHPLAAQAAGKPPLTV